MKLGECKPLTWYFYCRPPLRKIDKYVQPECPCCSMSKRFTQAVLVACGFLISFGIRCNVGVATVKMMSNTTNEEGDVTTPAEFHWSPETIGYVDSSFFWGYIVTQLPGGFLASRFPANRLFGTAIFLSSCLNLLIPAATKLDPVCVIVVRVLQARDAIYITIYIENCFRGRLCASS